MSETVIGYGVISTATIRLLSEIADVWRDGASDDWRDACDRLALVVIESYPAAKVRAHYISEYRRMVERPRKSVDRPPTLGKIVPYGESEEEAAGPV